MFDRFTETARRVLREAHEEALRRRHRSVDSEHLFLALLRQREGIALAVLDRLGLQRGAVMEYLERVLDSVSASAKPMTETPFGAGAARALEQSVQQARDLESNWVGTEHLLLALLQDGHSSVARTLGGHGVRFVTALTTVLPLFGKSIGPERGRRARLACDLLRDWDGALSNKRDGHRVGASAVARDAASGVGDAQEGRDELTVRGPTLSALELPRCEGLAITSYALVLQGVN